MADECSVKALRNGESATLPNDNRCDRFRDFEAEATNYDRRGTFASRRVPSARFKLRDTGLDTVTEEYVTMTVDVYVNRKRVKFINRSKFLVDVNYTTRCPV